MEEEKQRCHEMLDMLIDGIVAFKEAINILLPCEVQHAGMVIALMTGMNTELSKVWILAIQQEITAGGGAALLRGLLVQYTQIAIENLEKAREIANVPVA